MLQDLVRTLARFGVRLPGDLVLLSRALVTLDGTLRVLVAGHLAGLRGDRDDDVDRPRRADRPRRDDRATSCWPRCRTSAACPIGSTASSPSPAAASCASAASWTRTRVASSALGQPGAARRGRRGVPGRRPRSCSSPTTPGPTVADRDRAVRDLRLRRPLRRDRAPAAGRRRRGPGRDDMSRSRLISTPVTGCRRTSAPPGRLDAATAGRALLPPSRRRRSPGRCGARRRCCSPSLIVGWPPRRAEGVTTDLGPGRDARARRPCGSCLLALIQVAAVAVPVAVVVGLVVQRRWRRLGMVVLAGAAGAALFALARRRLRPPPAGSRTRSRRARGWLPAASRRSRSSPALAAAATRRQAVARRARGGGRADVAVVVVLVVVMAIAGTAGVPELLLAVAAGVAVGRGRPRRASARRNRRPRPPPSSAALRDGRARRRRTWRSSAPRAAGPSSTSPTSPTATGRSSRCTPSDSRDADLLYRGYRTAAAARARTTSWPSIVARSTTSSTRRCCCCWPRRAACAARRCEALARARPTARWRSRSSTSTAAARRAARPTRSTTRCSTRCGERSQTHARAPARPPRAACRQHPGGRRRARSIIDLGFGEESATPRLQAIDRAELLASLAALVGPERALASAARVLDPDDAGDRRSPYLQPLALSAATRKPGVEGAADRAPRPAIADATGRGARRRSSGSCGSGPARSHDRRARPARSTCSSRSSPTSATASRRCSSANWAWLARLRRDVAG